MKRVQVSSCGLLSFTFLMRQSSSFSRKTLVSKWKMNRTCILHMRINRTLSFLLELCSFIKSEEEFLNQAKNFGSYIVIKVCI
jgi:hypothetical protein